MSSDDSGNGKAKNFNYFSFQSKIMHENFHILQMEELEEDRLELRVLDQVLEQYLEVVVPQ